MNAYDAALADAQRTTELKPDWAKGYSRLGAAHFGLRQWEEACAAYTKGECKWAGLVGVRWVGGRAGRRVGALLEAPAALLPDLMPFPDLRCPNSPNVLQACSWTQPTSG